MRVFFWVFLFSLGNLLLANPDPVIWSGVGYFVDSGKTDSIYPNLTSLEKELSLSKLLANEFSQNENLIIGGSGNRSSEEGLNSVLIAVTAEKITSTYRGKNFKGEDICDRRYLYWPLLCYGSCWDGSCRSVIDNLFKGQPKRRCTFRSFKRGCDLNCKVIRTAIWCFNVF